MFLWSVLVAKNRGFQVSLHFGVFGVKNGDMLGDIRNLDSDLAWLNSFYGCVNARETDGKR